MINESEPVGLSAADGEVVDEGALETRLRDGVERQDIDEVETALEEMYKLWWRRMNLFACTRGLDEDSAQDFVQRAWIKAFERVLDRILIPGTTLLDSNPTPGGWVPKAKFKTWLYTILSHLIIDYFRSQSRHPTVDLPADESSEADLGVTDDSEQEIQKEDVGRLWQALELMDPQFTPYLLLRYLYEMPEEEVASVLVEKQTTVKGRLQTARRELGGIIVDLKTLEGVSWGHQAQVLRNLSLWHIRAWELFFVRRMPVKVVGTESNRQRPQVIGALREAFEHLRKNLSTLTMRMSGHE